MDFAADNHTIRSDQRRENLAEARARLERLARFLDTALRIPGTSVRFGADSVLNLVPGVGTLTAQGLAAFLVWEAHRLGAPAPLILRMLGNVGVDFLISAVPVVGWVGDVFYKANARNMALLREHLDRELAPGGPAWKGPIIDHEPLSPEDRR